VFLPNVLFTFLELSHGDHSFLSSALKMEVAGSAETLVTLYHTEGLHVPFAAVFRTYGVTFGGPALLAEQTYL